MLGAADVQARITRWFNTDVSVFGRLTSRTALLGWPFFAVNLGLIVAGFAARRRRSGGRDLKAAAS